VTGVTCMTSELSGKRLEWLKEAVPTASRIVFLSEPEDSPSGLKRAQDAAPALGIKLTTVGFKSRGELPRALEVVAKERPDALFVYPDPFTLMEGTNRRIRA
jgi:putative tryptophan/tyrosine transport system substrate-binding protein